MNDTDNNEKPTIGERYSTALGAGATRVAARASSGDIVLAAALQHNRVGAALLRLQAEYDVVRQDLERAGLIRPRTIERGRELLREAETLERDAAKAAKKFQDVERVAYERKALALRAEAATLTKERTTAEVLSARTFILLNLKTLTEAKQLVGALALRMSAKRKRPFEPDIVLVLAGKVIDVFLDPNCHQCDGTGKTGSVYLGEVEKQCRPCCGSGHRRDIIGQGQAQKMFSAVLFGELQRQVAAAARGMAKALSAPERIVAEADATDDLRAALTALRERLEILRSPAAEGE